ncbi:MAG: HEAT repeat domain-containing protein [Steroidobacteraceae bacterium]
MPLVRKPAASSTPRSPSPKEVFAGLGSADPAERWAAARAAAELPDLASALATALPKEAEPRVREAMLTGLVRIGTRESLLSLLPMLRADDAALRMGAVDALRSSVAIVREVLPRLLQDPSADLRIVSCELARALTSDEASRALCALLIDESDVNVCAAAIEVLAEVGTPAALPALAQCARRFAQAPFLSFAIRLATDRITAAGDRG